MEKKEKSIPGQENWVQSATGEEVESVKYERNSIWNPRKRGTCEGTEKVKLPLKAGEFGVPAQGHTSQSQRKWGDAGNS